MVQKNFKNLVIAIFDLRLFSLKGSVKLYVLKFIKSSKKTLQKKKNNLKLNNSMKPFHNLIDR